MTENIIKEEIIGARNISSILTMLVLFFAGIGFGLVGISSYLNINLIQITDTKEISFIPQGIVMLFYGTGAGRVLKK